MKRNYRHASTDSGAPPEYARADEWSVRILVKLIPLVAILFITSNENEFPYRVERKLLHEMGWRPQTYAALPATTSMHGDFIVSDRHTGYEEAKFRYFSAE